MRKYILTILGMLLLTIVTSAKSNYTLVIDAGHGGHDSGAVGAFSKEKDINLKTALAFGKYVEINCPDVKVIYTRKTDVFIPLHQRADIANKNHADVFISIHTNSAGSANKTVKGLETYTMGMRRSNEKLSAAQRENAVIKIEKDYKERYAGFDPNSPESAIMFEFMHDKNMEKSVELAQLVQKNVCSLAGNRDKGVKQDVFLVLRETSMPACLIELGFISTPEEEQFLNNDVNIDNIARGIYQAFVKYKGGGKVNVKPMVEKRKDDTKVETIKEKTEDTKAESKKEKTELKKEKTELKKEKVESKKEKIESKKEKIESKKEKIEPKKVEDKPKIENKPRVEDKPKAEKKNAEVKKDAIVFKVQIYTSSKQLKANDPNLKGQADVNFYRDNNLYKYTIGETTNYNEITKLRRELSNTFPEAFIVAFKNGERIPLRDAIEEYKSKK